MTVDELAGVFGHAKPMIGMAHLLPLPGSPGYTGDMRAIEERAVKDAVDLETAGFDGILVENFGDAPYYPERVPAETIAAMAAICDRLRESTGLTLGVNVLRNDARAAVAVATAVGAKFVRINVHTGAMVTDQGILSGRAHETLRVRKTLYSDALLFADVAVKHGYPMVNAAAEELALDCMERGLADALILTGRRTGDPVDTDELKRLKRRLRALPIIVGSGVNSANVRDLLSIADAAIVGTSIKIDGVVRQAIDRGRAAELIRAARER
jgi:membrane complex biogenesis BtpA family protein